MGQIRRPPSAKLFIAMLVSKDAQNKIDYIDNVLQNEFGSIDIISQNWPFDCTEYYTKEMGSGLLRRIVSFSGIIDPSEIVEIKHKTNHLEQRITAELRADSAGSESRVVNLDAGYLTLGQVILATTKSYSHRIYLRDGIWAEVTLYYNKGKYTPWPWTYPDYASGRYDDFWLKMREKLKTTQKEQPPNPHFSQEKTVFLK